jgi:heme exporter protein D
MNWNSPGEFLAMGGYTFYVWGSLIVTVAALAIEVVGLRRRQRQALLNLHRAKVA